MARRPGVTLVELLVVLVLVGVLASVAILRYQRVSDRGLYATLESDLRTLSIHQELYHAQHDTYAPAVALVDFTPSAPGSVVTVTSADRAGWAAYATHAGLAGHRCSIFMGTAPAEAPATRAGVIACDR